MNERGSSLIELLVVSAIVTALALAAIVGVAGTRPFALRSATSEFDALFARARALAATSGNGATIVFLPQPGGHGGTTIALLAGRPNAPEVVRVAASYAIAADARGESLGDPPFTMFVSSGGYVTGMGGYPALPFNPDGLAKIAKEPPCPGGALRVTSVIFSVASSSIVRQFPCPPVSASE
jgi:type II secretory pathway pseudopilin PulG